MTYDFSIRTASKKPLYGHVSPETAYVIDDYPSGFKARCRKRVWLEYKPKQGYRLVEQTSDKWFPGEEPAKDAALRWNKPKASTYALVAACMYLDAQDHVQWDQISGYTNPSKCLEFMKDFPKADTLGIKMIASQQLSYIKAKLEGKLVITLQGKPQPFSDAELGKSREELESWANLGKEVGLKIPPSVQDLIDGKVAPKQIDVDAFKADQLRKEEEAAAKADEASKAPGAMSYNEFCDRLHSLVDLKGRHLKAEKHTGGSAPFGGFDSLYVSFFNTSSKDSLDRDNNRQAYSVEGFDKKDPNLPVSKVKIELRIDMIGFGRSPVTKLRAKSGSPDKICAYLAAHINKIVKEVAEGDKVRTATTVAERVVDRFVSDD